MVVATQSCSEADAKKQGVHAWCCVELFKWLQMCVCFK
jgi:hypothetical protein